MGLFDCFPLSNAYSVNLDWILTQIKILEKYVHDYTAINQLKYDGFWDITKQYPKWALVTSGNASYISLQPVPAGIPLENSEYWLEAAELDPRIGQIIKDTEKMKEDISKNTTDITNLENLSGNVFSVANYKADNDFDSFNMAFNAAKSGDTIIIPNGDYYFTKSLKLPKPLNIVGANILGCRLHFTNCDGIDCANININGLTFANFSIIGNSKSNYHGIIGGSTLEKYNSAIFTIKNVYIDAFMYGIYGGAESAGVGLFDGNFINVWINNCGTGIKAFGSQNTYYEPRITFCDTGLALGHLNGESFDGGVIIGGIFIQNAYDIGIPEVGGNRPTSFIGTWFEQSTYGIINIPNANTLGLGLTFLGCMFNTNSTVYDLFNTYNYKGFCEWFDCTVIQTVVNGNTYISPTVKTNDYTMVSVRGERKVIGKYTYGTANVNFDSADAVIPHNLGTPPSQVFVSVVGENLPAVTVKAKNFDIIILNKNGVTGTHKVDYILVK